MAFENEVSIEILDAEVQQVQTALQALRLLLQARMINLTPAERQEYSRVGYETENFINLINGYMTSNPSLIPGYIDTAEFRKDLDARAKIKIMLNEVNQLAEMLDDTAMLIGSDLYQNAIAFYRAVKIASQQKVPGSTVIYEDLKQQFPGRPGKNTTPLP